MRSVEDVIDKVDRVCLCVLVVDLKLSDTCRVINSGILKAPDFLATFAYEGEKLDVHLDVVARHLLVVTLGVDFTHAGSARQLTNAVTAQNACHTSVRDCNAVITREIPDDPNRAEVIFALQVKDLLHDLGRCLIGSVLWNGLLVNQPGFAALIICAFPAIEA